MELVDPGATTDPGVALLGGVEGGGDIADILDTTELTVTACVTTLARGVAGAAGAGVMVAAGFPAAACGGVVGGVLVKSLVMA